METTPTSYRSSLLTYSICLFFTLKVSKGHSEAGTQANVSGILDYRSDLERNLLLLPVFSMPQASSSMFIHVNHAVLEGFSLIIRGLIPGLYTEFTDIQSCRFAKAGSLMPDGHTWPFEESTSKQELTQGKPNAVDFTG